ncbi:MAG: multiheme c-type cytochrome [Pseudomonadota bacterium]|nr:multiheme c-type cytochrome [Pseudomonadota bacterium]
MKPCRQTSLASLIIIGNLLLMLLFSTTAFAAKVTLDPESWGSEEGKACIDCHSKSSAGLTHQWKNSAHAQANVNCLDCHQAYEDDVDAMEHEGSIIATIVSPKDCGRCHETELKQQQGSVHTQALSIIENRMPALAEHFGSPTINDAGCAKCHGSKVLVRGDGTLDPATWPNSGIGRINPDGSVGSCSSCHGRHQFSKAQAREPSACIYCHSGPDSPDKEIYATSKHGMMFDAHRGEMNMESDQWVAGKDYSAAPTCVTCHMGAAGKMKSNHDVGMRDSWNLNAVVSEQQYLVIFEDGSKRELSTSDPLPRKGESINKLDGTMGKVKAVASPKRRRQAMTSVCLECHSKGFSNNAMQQFDNVVELFNEKYGKPAQAIMQELYSEKLLTPLPFDEPVEITYWKLWHNSGTLARHAAAMTSPSMTWKGMNDVGSDFYGKFLGQVRDAAGTERGDALIKKHVNDSEHHDWLNHPGKANTILGFGKGKNEGENESEGVAESAGEEKSNEDY